MYGIFQIELQKHFQF